MASVAPQVTVSSVSGSTVMPYQAAYFLASASRSRFAPQVMAYWLMSSLMAQAAASLMTAGAGKFGNPCARLIALCSVATRVIARMTDSVKPWVRRAVCISTDGWRLFQQQLRDRVQLHVARALIDRADLRVAVELLDRIFLRIPVAAEQLDAERGDALGHLRRVQLRHRGFHGVRRARVFEPRGVVHHEPRRLELRGGLGELEL